MDVFGAVLEPCWKFLSSFFSRKSRRNGRRSGDHFLRLLVLVLPAVAPAKSAAFVLSKYYQAQVHYSPSGIARSACATFYCMLVTQIGSSGTKAGILESVAGPKGYRGGTDTFGCNHLA